METTIDVKYIEHYGSDLRVVESARVSTATATTDTLSDRDVKLIKYLACNNHTTPFESSGLTVYIKCPIFIRSQIVRHRTFSMNELSRRYTSENIEVWYPDAWRKQAKRNRQSSVGALDAETQLNADTCYATSMEAALRAYSNLLSLGVAREQARAVLPQALITEFYFSGNLLNWMKFINLRIADDAQYEVRQVAEQCYALVAKHFPISSEALAR